MPSRPVLALLVVGLVLLPSPVYAGVVDSTARDRVPDGYSAERVDPDDPDDRARLAAAFDHEVTVYPYHVADGPPNRYHAPNRTARVLRRAYHGDTVRVTDEAVRADVTLIAAGATFVALDADHGPRRLVLDRSGDAFVVSTRAANASDVFLAVRDEAVVHYEALPPAERATVDRVLNASAGSADTDAYYRPYRDEPHPFPAVVERNGTHYFVRSTIVVDDNAGDRFFGLLGSGLGLCLLLVGGVVALFERRDG